MRHLLWWDTAHAHGYRTLCDQDHDMHRGGTVCRVEESLWLEESPARDPLCQACQDLLPVYREERERRAREAQEAADRARERNLILRPQDRNMVLRAAKAAEYDDQDMAILCEELLDGRLPDSQRERALRKVRAYMEAP